MAKTYTQIFIHLIFAVSLRKNFIKKNHKEKIEKYIAGIFSHNNIKMICINSMPDHIHILFSLSPDKSVSEIVRTVKANSSRFINSEGMFSGKFQWQEGYGAFSHSKSQVPQVVDYITNQQLHHHTASFQEEYMLFLEKNGIEYDKRYVFDFYQ